MATQTHLTSDHDMSDLILGPYRQDKIPWLTVTLPNKKTPIFPFLHERLLSLLARDVTVEPPGGEVVESFRPTSL